MDTAIKHKITKHLETQASFKHTQHDKYISYTRIFEGVNKYVDERKPADIIYLHFQKVFNKVQRLLMRFYSHGIKGQVLWRSDWSKNRKQIIKEYFSQSRNATSETPRFCPRMGAFQHIYK